VQERYNKLFEEAAEYKKKIVAIQTVEQDRDMRVNALRTDIEKLTNKFETLEKEHAVLNVNHKTLTNDHKKLNEDYGVLATNL